MPLPVMTDRTALFALIAAILVLSLVSLFIGVSDVSLHTLLSSDPADRPMQVLLISRIPRTLAIILSGTAMAVAGTIMQLLTRNHFVEPSTAGTVESASLGILVATLFMPGMPLLGKMLVATLFALAGTFLFLQILRQIPLRSVLVVPLVGLMLGGVISAITSFFAYRYDLLQSLNSWTTGDFSGVLRGRYELLWIGFALTIAAYFAADRFTVAGLGEAFTTNLGLNYRRVMTFGLTIVAMVTATIVVTIGIIPFLGLVVPNLVRMIMGDNLRRALPFIAASGAILVLICDMAGRLVRFPYEIPIGTMFGVVGSALFIFMLMRRRARVG